MANTERLDLFKVPTNPSEQETTNFNTETMLNENWAKIDKNVALIDPVTGKLLPGQENPVDITEFEQQITDLSTKLGNLPNLSTTVKDNLVGAINELKTELDNLDNTTEQGFTQLANTLNNLENELATHLAKKASLTQDGHVQNGTYTTTLNTTWSGSEAPYTKTQTVTGILASDTPIIDVVMSGTFETDEERIDAWGNVYRAVTSANTVTFYATEKPEVSLPIQLKVVR